jgi:hypothetical protein
MPGFTLLSAYRKTSSAQLVLTNVDMLADPTIQVRWIGQNSRVSWLYLDSLQEILGMVKFGVGDQAPIVAPDECQVRSRQHGK